MTLTPRIWFALVVCCLAAPLAHAGTISIGWDPVEHTGLLGYRVYYDTVPDRFAQSADAGNVTSLQLDGLDDCTDYWVAVKAYDASGGESPLFSNVVAGWARPRVAGASPSVLEQGSRQWVVIDGANFQTGASVTIPDAPSLTVHQTLVDDCNTIRIDLEVEGSAPSGTFEVEVLNPDQVFGRAAVIAVNTDVTGPAIGQLAINGIGGTTATVQWQTDEPADAAVFYRRTGETTYLPGPTADAGATEHLLQLQGLMPDTDYEIYVRSADGAGNASVSPVSGFRTASSPYHYVRIEAEAGQLAAPLAAVEGAGSFGGRWIEVPDGTPTGTLLDPAGTATLDFQLPAAGTWYVWVRLYGAAPDADSWFESVDDEVPAPIHLDSWGSWQWVAGRAYALDAGLHSLVLGGREAATPADRVLITDDPDFVPTEMPGDDSTPPDPVQSLTANVGDTSVTLSWIDPAEPGLTIVGRFRTDGVAPANPNDGWPLFEQASTPGQLAGYLHSSLQNGTTYVYSVFAVDDAGNVSAATSTSATPAAAPPGSVQNLSRTDAR